MWKRVLSVGVLAAAVLLPVAAQQHLQAHSPAPEAVARGRVQFQRSCGFCHGSDATGGAEGPNLVQSSIVRHDKDGDLIGQVIREGRPNRGMPPIPLTADQIADVVAFLHARVIESDRTSPGRAGSSYSLKTLLTGNAEEGKKFFFGAGHCSECHSPTGDLAGIAKKYPPAELEARFLYPDSHQPSRVTVTLPSGAKRNGELVYMDGFNVGIQEADGWYHSWLRSEVRVEIHDPLAAHKKLLPEYTEADIHNLFAYLETLK